MNRDAAEATADSRTADNGDVNRPDGPSSYAAWRAIIRRRGIDATFFLRTALQYPRLAHVQVGPEHVYLVNHPDLVHTVLVEAARQTTKARAMQGARRILGDGLLSSEEPLHHQQRRLIAPAFHHTAIERYGEDIRAAADAATADWGPGHTVDMAAAMGAITFDAVGRALFGADVKEETAAMRHALADLLAMYRRAYLPGLDLAIKLRLPFARRLEAAAHQLDAVVAKVIREHPDGPVLRMLIDAGMDEQQVRDETLTLLLAGHETTAAALTMAWVLLSDHPETACWLLEHPDERATAVIAETMRLYPPAWMLGRRLTKDLKLDGWEVAAGATCLSSPLVLHRDPRWWTAPREFRPWRWIDAHGRYDATAPGQPRSAYIPFGAGRRMCIGESFAWSEATTVLTMLMQRWSARRSTDGPIPMRAAITLRPAGAVPMRLSRR